MKSSPARMFSGTPKNLRFLANRLRNGELVAVPTETVYGLAANAFDPRACAKIFRAKGRPATDPLIVHIHSLTQLDLLCDPNPAALTLAAQFWPGPLTLVLPKKKTVPDIVTSGRDSVAVRMPSHRLFRQLLKATGLPLAAPSANPFGYISPTRAEHVQNGLGTKIRYILDGGSATIGLESTIVDLRDPQRPTILRPGAVTASEVAECLKRKVVTAKRASDSPEVAQISPGLLARHYSPRTRMTLHERMPPAKSAAVKLGEAFVYLARPPGPLAANVFWLDEHGELAGIARSLFATLRTLDAMNFQMIHLERPTTRGLGAAINDRLTRAAAR